MEASSVTTSFWRLPATATVETWEYRRSPWRFCARRASCITSSEPRRFTLRHCFSDLRLQEALACFLLGFRADKEIQAIGVAGKQARRKVAAEISGGTCQENSHRRMTALQRIAAEAASSGGADQLSARGSRASSGLPSIKG